MIDTVGIVGAGTIGASWSALFSAAGKTVRIHDPSPNAETYVRDYIDNAWPTLVALGLVRPGAPGAVTFHATPAEAVAGAGFVQESVPERMDVKHAVFAEMEPALAPGAVVSTSASGLRLSEMQKAWRDPSRFLLGHPFNPPHLIPLVELYGTERTDPAAIDVAQAFYESCGKATIRLNKEIPGHVSNRLQAALWREAIHLAVEGVASVEDVDKAIWAGPGLRWSVMGPHMLFNLASGGQGFRAFCEHFGPGIESWWDDLGKPRLTPEVVAALAEGIREAEHGRDFPSLAAERDRKIVAHLNAVANLDDD
ncbi:MAG: 3-hydroxyacyl-CoA dehydrogenase NAD-binding domain-containing protein [Rhodospirillaceae bacterium]